MISLPVDGVSGCVKSNGGLGLFAPSNGQMDASSSGINVDTDGDVVRDSGSSTLKNDGFTKLFMLDNLTLYHTNLCSRTGAKNKYSLCLSGYNNEFLILFVVVFQYISIEIN